MDFTDPTDLSPLSFGAGLALGLMLILGLPRADGSRPARGGRESVFDLRSPQARPAILAEARPSPANPRAQRIANPR